MRYKTTILITTEAADKTEAIEIVGEYLSGNLVSGIDMKCRTAPAVSYKGVMLSVALFSLIAVSAVLFSATIRSVAGNTSNTAVSSAIQPPLKTSSMDNERESFKEDWKSNHTKKILEYIKSR